MVNEEKIKQAFSRIKYDIDGIKKNYKQIIDLLQKINNQKREQIKPIVKPVVKPVAKKIFRSIKERRGKKRSEVKLAILKTLEENKDLCTIEIEEKIMKECEISRGTFYNYLRSLKDNNIIREKDMDGNKGYILIGEK